jgi:AAA family ATP:ADP antiporter
MLDRQNGSVHSRSRRVKHRASSSIEVAAWAAATFAALLGSSFAFRPVRDALILDRDPENLPWVFIGTFTAVSIASVLWSKLLAHRAPRGFVPRAFHAFAACLLVFSAIVYAGLAPVAVGRAFYIWSAVFNLFVVSVFWSLLADLIGPGRARKLYGPIAVGGTVGTVIGPFLTRQLVGTIDIAGVLLMSAALLEIAVICVSRVRRLAERLAPEPGTAAPEPEPEQPPGGGAFTGIAHVARSPYLSTIVGYVLCTTCAATFMYLEQARLVHDALGDRVARTRFFADVELWTSIVTLVMQGVLARPALRWLGPGVVLAVLPFVQVASISILTLAPSLTALAILQVLGRSTAHGLTRPARELLYTVVSRDEKYRAKHAIDTIAYRFGDMAASWLRAGLLALGTGAGVMIGAIVPIGVLWIGLASLLGAGFRRRLTKEPP